MKTFTQIIITALSSSLISSATAAPPPEGYITTYADAECGQINGAINKIDTYIPLNGCVNLAPFLSFQGGMGVACPAGLVPDVTAYTKTGCVGTAVDAGGIPSDYFDGACVEILRGQSAYFRCVDES